MNSLNDNIHTALGVVQDKKVRVWALDRGACSKSKLNVTGNPSIHTHLGKQMRAAHSICTRVGPKHQNLCMGNWNITSLKRKEQELETEQYHLDIVGVFST